MAGVSWGSVAAEAVVLCAAFHAVIYLIIRYKPEMEVYSYPPAITQRWIDLGKVPVKEVPDLKEKLTKKLPAALVIGVILAPPVYFINGCRSFTSAFLVTYLLWLIVDWYDALILDCLWFAHSKTCVLEGTEDLTKAYRDYAFYIKGSAVGMLIGLPVCAVVGAAVKVISLL